MPQLACKGDAAIMDVMLQYNFTPLQQKQINHCRLYIQVLMLSNIMSADGQNILPEIIHGHRPQFQSSSLQWPDYPRPTNWSAWRMLLQHITIGVCLNKPLGNWIEKSHQRWEWFYLASTDQLLHVSQDSTKIYNHLPHNSLYPSRRNHRAFTTSNQPLKQAMTPISVPPTAVLQFLFHQYPLFKTYGIPLTYDPPS
jgi:hypothetical protein